jgi:hypothetical protein
MIERIYIPGYERTAQGEAIQARADGTREASIAAALRYSLDNSISGITSEPGLGRIELLFRELPQLVADSPETQVFQYELTLESGTPPGCARTCTSRTAAKTAQDPDAAAGVWLSAHRQAVCASAQVRTVPSCQRDGQHRHARRRTP